jgi:hypothetical protein
VATAAFSACPYFCHAALIHFPEVVYMSYRVEYSSSGIKRTQIRQRNGRALLLTAVCFLIFLLIVGGFWPRGAQALRDMLLPGDSAVTAAAWAELTRELHAGAPVGSAVENFCREVFANAGLCPG